MCLKFMCLKLIINYNKIYCVNIIHAVGHDFYQNPQT